MSTELEVAQGDANVAIAGRVYRFELAYQGAAYHGWQVQAEGRACTVQGTVQDALSKLASRPVKVNGASRTDAGVHALGQVVSVPWPQGARLVPPNEMMRALHALLPDDMSVLRLEVVEGLDARGRAFHARHCARGKRYRYRYWTNRVPQPFLRHQHWHLKRAPSEEGWLLAQEAAKVLLGTHDFGGFRAADCAAEDTTRTLHRVELVAPQAGDFEVQLVVEGSSFLKNMVRILAGTLLEVAQGKMPPSALERILETRDRGLAGQTAPAHGLCLEEVFYPDFPWSAPRWTMAPR